MIIIRTKFFDDQIINLSKKYSKIELDFDYFSSNLDLEPFYDLGKGFFKYRIKNSSIPTGKRGGFRLIIKKFNNKILPLFIYSKTQKENILEREIIYGLEKVLDEL